MRIIPRIISTRIPLGRSRNRCIPPQRTLTGLIGYIGILQTLPIIKRHIEGDIVRIEERNEVSMYVRRVFTGNHGQFNPFVVAVHLHLDRVTFLLREGHHRYGIG